ncbi:MAG TPA: YbaK/EbsC family protein [Pseudogracilibacillus sp.]|nr:YbaK/EbsC family protein [Pseudogracilibacillus sp.]
MSETLKPSAQLFQEKLQARGFSNAIVELPESTRTAKEAAKAIECRVEEIAKSIVFKMESTGEPILVVASGTNRINEKTIEQEVNDTLGKATASFVKEKTGYSIGGVPPTGHTAPVLTLLDEDLWKYDTIWAAAGHAMAVFKTTPDELQKMTGSKVLNVS